MALYMMPKTKELLMVLAVGKGQRKRVSVACFGGKRHYAKDGTCFHTDAFLADMKPWWRSRADVAPFGKAKELPVS